ncbi:hypothetical protein C2S52_022656 [Perilla frutescens var. hirtella]|nr:hypothetical protein C2S52_022656 [Perilla frutescens var. hirtella]
MKMRNKGKVHPFTSSSSSSSSSSNTESFSVLKLLPAAILTLVSFLSLEEREVLAYMITRSLKSTNPSFFPANEDKKKTPKKQCAGHNSPALFDCDCFHCYTSFWFRWDSSPNRELIHQAIEAFEDHLSSGEHLSSGKTKRRDKLGRRRTEKLAADAVQSPANNQERPFSAPVTELEPAVPEIEDFGPGSAGSVAEEDDVAAPAVVVRTHKGLARKVLPDVMGIFTSRLWSLWSPNV